MKRSQKILFWTLTIFVLLLFAGVLLPTLAGSRESVAVIRSLPLGWLSFLSRTVPEVTIDWAGVGMVVICSAVILACLHSLLNALTQKRFQFRWSMSIFASVWLLFCLIIAVTGLSRTIALLKSEKWFQARSGYADLRMASLHASMALSEAGTDLNYLRRLLMDSERWRPFWEEFEFLVCSPEPGKAPWIIVIPRDVRTRERVGFSLVTDMGSEDSIPIGKLQEKLAGLRKTLAQTGTAANQSADAGLTTERR